MTTKPKFKSSPDFINGDEWAKLHEHGYDSDYVRMHGSNPRIIDPCVTLEEALAGWFPKGTKAKWVDHNGYDYQRDQAREKIGTDRILTVKCCRIGHSSSTYEFEEVEGQWNSVMFEKIDG